MKKTFAIFNEFNLIGRMCNTPQKEFTKNNQLFTRITLKTRFRNEIYIPIIIFGKEVDVVCTKFQIGDVVAIKGQISSREKQDGKLMIDFVATEMQLISKTNFEIVQEDKFLKIIELYDPEKVAQRMIKK